MRAETLGHSSLAHIYIIVLISSLAIGLFLPTYGSLLYPFVTYLLGAIFFFSALKLHVKDIIETAHEWKTIVLITLLKLILIPIVIYSLTSILIPHIAFAFLLLSVMPTAMTAPLFTAMAHGKQSLSLVLSIITSLIVPISAPFMIRFLAPASVSIDIINMGIRMALVIAIPILAAEFIKHATPKIGQKLSTLSRGGSLTALGLLLIGVISVNAEIIIDALIQHPFTYLLPLCGLFIIMHIMSYFLFSWLSYKKRIAATVSIAYMNFTLAIYIATTFFPDPHIVLPIIISAIPWSIAIIPFAEFAEHHEPETSKAKTLTKRPNRKRVIKKPQ